MSQSRDEIGQPVGNPETAASSPLATPITAPPRGTPMTDEQAMRLALSEAMKGAPFVSPNPRVGAVILDGNGKFLSAGYHAKYGGPHAEVHAVAQLAESDLKDAQAFVTLEPCAHEGKTPSCAKMLARHPFKRVVYGMTDPNPLVSGQGAQIVRDAGIQCELYRDVVNGDLEAAFEEVAEAFLWNYRHQKVFVILKIGSSLDGKVALADGTSQWITGPEARLKSQELRAATDAILIGAGTLEKDNPSLDIRLAGVLKANKVVVLDSKARLFKNSWKIFSSHPARDVFWAVGSKATLATDDAKAALEAGSQALTVQQNGDGRLDLSSLLAGLWDAGVRSVLVEGGGQVAGAFLRAGLVNRLHLFQAPVLLGGQGMSWTQGLSVTSMKDRPTLKNVRTATVGDDFHLTGLLRDPKSGA